MKRRSLIAALGCLGLSAWGAPVLTQAASSQWKPTYSNRVLVGATNGTQHISIPLEGQMQLTAPQQLVYEKALQSPGEWFISEPYFHAHEGRTYRDSVVFHIDRPGFEVVSRLT